MRCRRTAAWWGSVEGAGRDSESIPEAGHDLVKAQQGAVLMREVLEALQELFGGRDEARVADHRLQDHACHLVLVLLKKAPHAVQVVVGGCQGGLCKRTSVESLL